ncbi:MAG: 2,3-bisphosphoglycerate-dependent phosphoglycerate mutase [archaeon]
MAKLVLVRHGQSVWNLAPNFTGWVDVLLTPQGRAEAEAAGKALVKTNLTFDAIFTSTLIRAHETLLHLLYQLHLEKTLIFHSEYPDLEQWAHHAAKESILPVFKAKALNERYYGDLQGLNKNETIAKYGAQQVHIWRRSYSTPPPNGENLKETCARAIPYYQERILPLLNQDKNVLVVAHGNSLRGIIMYLENISETDVSNLEIPLGVPIVYEIVQGKILNKSILET